MPFVNQVTNYSHLRSLKNSIAATAGALVPHINSIAAPSYSVPYTYTPISQSLKRPVDDMARPIKKQKASNRKYTPKRSLARPLTFQRDQAVSYRKRRVPRRIRKRAQRSLRTYQRNASHFTGSRFYVSNAYNGVTIAAGNQGYLDLPVMSRDRIMDVFQMLYPPDLPGTYTAETPTTTYSANKGRNMVLRKFRCEHEIHNTGDSILYFDIYYYRARFQTDQSFGLSFASPPATEVAAVPNMAVSSAFSSNPQTILDTTPGVTPFHMSNVTQKYMITSIRRIMLQPGQSMTYSQSGPSYVKIDTDQIQSFASQTTPQFKRIDVGSFLIAQPNIGDNNSDPSLAPTLMSGKFTVHSQYFCSTMILQSRRDLAFVGITEKATNDGQIGST